MNRDFESDVGPQTQDVSFPVPDALVLLAVELVDFTRNFLDGALERWSVRSGPFRQFREIEEADPAASQWPDPVSVLAAFRTWQGDATLGDQAGILLSAYETATEDAAAAAPARSRPARPLPLAVKAATGEPGASPLSQADLQVVAGQLLAAF